MRTVMSLLLLSALAIAEPRVRVNEYDTMDFEGLKVGAWIEIETTDEHPGEGGKVESEKTFERTACVKVEDEFVWFEDTRWSATRPDEKETTLAQVRRKDHLTVKAWSGKPGGEGKDLELDPVMEKEKPLPGTTLKGKVSTEKTTFDGKEIDAQKIEVVISDKSGSKESSYTFTVWSSPEVPFRLRFQDAEVLENMFGLVTWDKTPAGPAGMVKAESKGFGGRSTMVATYGVDAKPTLTIK